MADQLIWDYREAPLAPADRLLCDFAVKLTRRPGRMEEADVRRLLEAGFSEQEVTVAVQVIGYFNYINRVADGLGVDPEAWMTPGRDEWLRGKAEIP